MNSIENIGLIAGYIFMVLALSLMCWSFTGLFTDKKWKRLMMCAIILVISGFILMRMDPSTEVFNFKILNGH